MPDEVQALLRQYLDVHIREGVVDATQPELQASLPQRTQRLQDELCSHALWAAEVDKSVVTSGLFIQSLNELIDTCATRNAALNRKVPEVVLLRMVATVVLTTGTLGYASGVAGHRVTLAAFVMVTLDALVAYLSMDPDRPRRGAIQVSHESLLSLQRAIGTAQGGAADRGGSPDMSQAPRRRLPTLAVGYPQAAGAFVSGGPARRTSRGVVGRWR